MKRILIVDDSESARVALRKDLEESGYQVLEGKDGVEGLQLVAEQGQTIHFVISDLSMPNMDGLQMVQKIKEIHGAFNLGVFMLTTEASPQMKARAKEHGVRAWIIKPYAKDKLLAALAKILG